MLPVLIASALTCSDATALVDKMREYKVSDELKLEMISIVKEETSGCWDAQVDWRNGLNTLLLWRNPMASVTYRGVEYDTEEYNKKVLAEATQERNHDLMYRGIRHPRKFASKS